MINNVEGNCIKRKFCEPLRNNNNRGYILNNHRLCKPNSLEGWTDGETEVCCDRNHLKEHFLGIQSRSLPEDGICGRSGDTTRIYGGSPTKPGDYPWMAVLKYRPCNSTVPLFSSNF